MELRYRLEFVPQSAPRLVRLTGEGSHQEEIPLVSLGEPFMAWQLTSRINNLRFFLTGQGEREFAVHTGYMATASSQGFPLNVAAKGLGLLPRGDLSGWTAALEELIAKAGAKGEESTRKERLEFLLHLYEKESWDDRVLTTIELYGKATWKNVHEDPRCSVLFSSYRNTSFLVNGVVEVVPPGHPVYRYVVALHDLFHLPGGPRRDFPGVYRIWACEVWDKTPGPRAGTRTA